MSALPEGFQALAPFIAQWAGGTTVERAEARDRSTPADREAFYAAAQPLLPSALDLLDSKALGDLDASEKRLMNLMLSLAHVALAVEAQGDDEPRHAVNRAFLKITRASADA
jgi:hypothetical protein